MKKTKTRIVSLFLSILTVFGCMTALATPAAAAETIGIFASVSTEPVTANPSVAPFPYNITDGIEAETQVYLNIGATTHYKLSSCRWYVKTAGGSYTYVGGFTAKNYFRYSATSFKFYAACLHTIMCEVTLTNGEVIRGTIDINVSPTSFSPVWPCSKSTNYISTMYRYWNSGNPTSHRVRSNKYNALDISGSKGDTIYAVEGGTVVEKGYQSKGFGYYVVIKHDNGLYSLYGHLKSSASVNKNDSVKRGQTIGYMGSTGDSTGPHLHFEMYDPNDYGKVIAPWKSYYQGKVNVTVGGNSYKANSRYTNNDTLAKEWCDWLLNSCTKNKNGDYVFKTN